MHEHCKNNLTKSQNFDLEKEFLHGFLFRLTAFISCQILFPVEKHRYKTNFLAISFAKEFPSIL